MLLKLALVLAAAVYSAGAQTDSRALCAQIPPLAEELQRISGLPLKHPVPCDYISKDKINQFLKNRVKDVAKPSEIHAEELTLKLFGLVPPEFNLAENTVDLLTEQAAAFYDYEKKKLFITDTTQGATQQPVLVHELAHAIADQNYNLARFIKQGRKSDDGSTARMAVMEGQATWLMSEFLARRGGQSLKDSPALVAAMSSMSDSANGQFPVFDNSPLYLRSTLVFPYTRGMLFQNAVFEHSGQKSFGEVFLKPPASTQQILHPDKYFAGLKPTQPELPDLKPPKGFKGVVGGTLGELDHQIMLEQYSGKDVAADLAPHWRGCTFAVLENVREKRTLLVYAVEWDTEDAARSYFAAYRRQLEKKWKHFSVATESPTAIDGTGDPGRFELRLNGKIVTSAEGLNRSAALP